MKIVKAKTQVVRQLCDEPIANGPPGPGTTRDFVTLRLQTDAGIEGIGITFFGGALTPALHAAVEILAEQVIGEDPLRIEAILEKLRKIGFSTSGPGGIFTLALAAIDLALWDIKGKAFNVPLATLLGGVRDTVPTYASGALRRIFPLDHVVKTAPRLVEMGFRQMKMQLALPGESKPTEEVRRARLIRESIGPDIDLMCDINQLWSVNQMIDIGKRIENENVHLFWLEDVTVHDDYQGWARVAQALATPVAGGEYVYGVTPFRHMLEAGSVDIVMIDVIRAGGITQWMKIAGMAQAFNLPVVSHVLPEVHVHLIAAIPNGLTVEYMPWSLRLFKETPKLKDGHLVVPDRPGLGLEFDPETIARCAVN